MDTLIEKPDYDKIEYEMILEFDVNVPGNMLNSALKTNINTILSEKYLSKQYKEVGIITQMNDIDVDLTKYHNEVIPEDPRSSVRFFNIPVKCTVCKIIVGTILKMYPIASQSAQSAPGVLFVKHSNDIIKGVVVIEDQDKIKELTGKSTELTVRVESVKEFDKNDIYLILGTLIVSA